MGLVEAQKSCHRAKPRHEVPTLGIRTNTVVNHYSKFIKSLFHIILIKKPDYGHFNLFQIVAK